MARYMHLSLTKYMPGSIVYLTHRTKDHDYVYRQLNRSDRRVAIYFRQALLYSDVFQSFVTRTNNSAQLFLTLLIFSSAFSRTLRSTRHCRSRN